MVIRNPPGMQVDAHVGDHITQECLVKALKGTGKLVVLCSHQLRCRTPTPGTRGI